MQCKSYDTLPFERLFEMAEEKYEQLEYEDAEYFYELAYKKNPQNQMLVLCYAHLLKSIQKESQAQIILEKSLKELPTGTYKRYFELAEIYEGVKSIKTFEKGIEQAHKCLANPFKSTAPQPQIKRDIAQAYASIAEVCMTDLLQEKQAEAKCIQSLEKGKKFDDSCIDVRLQIANYLMFKDDFDRAKIQLIEIYKWITQNREEYEPETITSAGKYLIEVQEYKKSFELFQRLHEDQSNEAQVLYMLAFCSFKLQQYERCEQFLDEYAQCKDSNELIDEEIEEAVKQLKQEMKKKKKNEQPSETGQGDDEEWMDVEDDDEEI